MLQDVGSTFGPNRVDLEAWKASKIWEDRRACKLSMEELPYGGGTFGSTRVSERGRSFLVKLLEQLSDAQLADLFAGARFDKPRSALNGTRSVPEWVRVFKSRVRTISEGPPCPDGVAPLSGRASRASLYSVPASIVSPVREIAWKCSASSSISISMK